jgi:phosphoglycolate phosphatase-like HAD superfamily hydrolase
MVVIGDTPHDVSCGKVIEARTLAVATGPGLLAGGARGVRAVGGGRGLPPPEEFVELIGL